MRFSAVRVWMTLIILCSAPAFLQAQQQYGLPGTPNEYLTQSTSPPSGATIDVTYVAIGFNATQTAAITAAANAWNASGANVLLTTAPSAHTIFIINSGGSAGSNPTDHNLVINPAQPNPPMGFYPDGTGFRNISGALITVNQVNSSGLPWHNDSTTAPLAGELDLESYLIREFGFALGLGLDLGGLDPASVMGNTPPGAGVSARTPSAGDVAALQTLYGAPEPATWALFGVGLAALGAAKKSRRRLTAAA